MPVPAIVLVVAYSLLIAILSLIPGSTQPASFPGIDKVEHFLAYAVFGCIVFPALRPVFRRSSFRYFVTFLFVTLYGILMEVAQGIFTSTRTAEIGDAVADAVGVLSSLALLRLYERRKQMPSAVIFDFDGIIVDTEPLHYRAFQKILGPLGLGYSWDEYVDRYMGFDDRDAFREAYRSGDKQLDDPTLESLIAAKGQAFLEIIDGGVPPYPGVLELVRKISGNIPLALCSGALPSDIHPILRQLGIDSCFDVIVTAADVAASKPDPQSYQLALRLLSDRYGSLEPARAVAIEDTPAGIASASGAGIRVLAVTNSYPADALRAASRIVPSLEGIDLENLGVF